MSNHTRPMLSQLAHTVTVQEPRPHCLTQLLRVITTVVVPGYTSLDVTLGCT